MKSQEEFYATRVQELNTELKENSQRLSRIVTIRLVLAAIIVGVVILWFTRGVDTVSGVLVVVAAVSFGRMVKIHITARAKSKRLKTLLEINENELRVLKNDVSGNADGAEYQDFGLPNAFDLDLFGKRSLYQHVSRCATPEGAGQLAEIFRNPMHGPKDIRIRQEQLKELSEKALWRQQFQALGIINKAKKEWEGSLESWFGEKDIFLNQASWLKWALWISPAICVALIVMYGLGVISAQWPVYYGLFQLLWVGRSLKKVNRFHMGLSRRHQVLERYAALLEHVDSESFESSEIKRMAAESASGAKAIRSLKQRMNLLDSRLNAMMAIVLNGVFLWDIRCVLAIEKWKGDYLKRTRDWISTIAQMDALNSMANYTFNHSDFTWPAFDDEVLISAQAMGHPFLAKDVRVSNDFELQPKGQLILLSGANMSGKSTFLRTVGLNMVMAEMGFPVCAESLVIKPLPVYTSMRINDSLQDSESYFYSELKRLKFLIDHIKQGNEIMVLLDEILRGTNSNDKHHGSIGLIEQLLGLQTSGIIASHDIALASLAEQYPNKVLNRSFEVENENGELVFDYKLREGVCQNLNASYLMKKMGITAPE